MYNKQEERKEAIIYSKINVVVVFTIILVLTTEIMSENLQVWMMKWFYRKFNFCVT